RWSARRAYDRGRLGLDHWPRGDGDAAGDNRAHGQSGASTGHELAAGDHRPQLFGPVLGRTLTRARIDIVRHRVAPSALPRPAYPVGVVATARRWLPSASLP